MDKKTTKRKLRPIKQYKLDTSFSNDPKVVSIRNIEVYRNSPRTYSYDIWIGNSRVNFGLLNRAKNKVELEKSIKEYIKDEYGQKKKKSKVNFSS